MKPRSLGFAGLFLCTVSTATPLHTSLESPGTLSLLSVEQAVEHALAHHPSLAARRAIESVRDAQTTQAKLALLPRVEVSAQLLRATGNVVAGTVWPQPGVPAVSGPPGPEHFDGGAFGSGIGIGGSWDVTGLPARMKLLDGALAAQFEAKYALEARQLEIAYAAADAVLQVWAAQAMVRAEAASVERARMLVTVVEALQRADLRPGADLSRGKRNCRWPKPKKPGRMNVCRKVKSNWPRQ